eukprot:bmy_11872T0
MRGNIQSREFSYVCTKQHLVRFSHYQMINPRRKDGKTRSYKVVKPQHKLKHSPPSEKERGRQSYKIPKPQGRVLQAAGTAVQHPATAEPGLPRKQHTLLKRQCKAKKEALPKETPEVVKTHLQDIIILPEMVESMVGVYKVKTFNQVESSLSSQSPTQPVIFPLFYELPNPYQAEQ